MGSGLVLVLVTILYLADRSESGLPVVIASAIALLGAILEVSRMGKLRELHLMPVMLASAAGVFLLVREAMQWTSLRPYYEGLPDSFVNLHAAQLRLGYAWTLAIAAATYGLSLSLRAWPRLGDVAPRAMTYAVIGAVLVFVSRDATARLAVGFVVLFGLALTTLPLVLRRANGGKELLVTVLLCLWIVPPLPGLWAFWTEWGTTSLVALLFLSKIGDTFGYYVGNAFGKTHPFPKISPGKTTAGCVGSFLGATATGGGMALLGLWHDTYQASLVGGMVGGAILNLAAQSADLLESWVKRRAGVKDSSTIFGPSGGVLDQVDSLLLTIPVGLCIWPVPVGAG